MSNSENPKSSFEFEENWESIEITGLMKDANARPNILYLLKTAVSSQSDLLIAEDKITIKGNIANNKSLLLEVTLERLLVRFNFLEAISF